MSAKCQVSGVRCCVCGKELGPGEAYQVGYSLAGWPAVVPVSVVVCRSGGCVGVWDDRAAKTTEVVTTKGGRQLTLSLEAA